MIKKKKVNFPLTYSHHTKEMLLQQYIDDKCKYNDKRLIKVVDYITQLPEFEQTVYLLKLEYGNYRLVAEETNVNYVTIFNIIKQINQQIIEHLNT